jgi:hypothetical protein
VVVVDASKFSFMDLCLEEGGIKGIEFEVVVWFEVAVSRVIGVDTRARFG